jgi:hypothetical protein
MEASKLKAARLLEQMSAHLSTDAGKEIAEKVGFVYQLNISPKVRTPIPNAPLLFTGIFLRLSRGIDLA